MNLNPGAPPLLTKDKYADGTQGAPSHGRFIPGLLEFSFSTPPSKSDSLLSPSALTTTYSSVGCLIVSISSGTS
jgi:hypothetical protein